MDYVYNIHKYAYLSIQITREISRNTKHLVVIILKYTENTITNILVFFHQSN